jgi:hypothetical protein
MATSKNDNDGEYWFNFDITHLLMSIGKELGVGNISGNLSNLLQEICDKYPEISEPLRDLLNKRKAVYDSCLKDDLNELKESQDSEEKAVEELKKVFYRIKKNLP